MKMFGKLLLWGLAAFGGYKVYEASPLALRAGGQYAGQRNMGTIEEAFAWERAGSPRQTRMG